VGLVATSDGTRAEFNFSVSLSLGITTQQYYQGDGWAALSNYGWMFRRAPGFFDVVAYTGTGSARTVAHNLGVAPELMIVKSSRRLHKVVLFILQVQATQTFYVCFQQVPI
jgi:hypothetical protein